MEHLEKRGVLETTVDSDGLVDVFELFSGTDVILLHREALLATVENNNLLEEYTSNMDVLLEEVYGSSDCSLEV